jgi:LDH2 family malate/lactate/ureidoglycolate dehydrogenase
VTRVTDEARGVGPMELGRLQALVEQVLAASGVAGEDAAVVAHEMVDAEARGYGSQGMMRLASYVEGALAGRVVSPTRVRVLREGPASLSLDGGNGWGHRVARDAMDRCVARARGAGSCIAAVRNLGHIGRLGYYVEAAAEAGVVGMIAVSGNPASAAMAPWGGREARLSTNPLAIGFPNPAGPPVVVDVSTTQAARGKVLLAAAAGDAIPDGWAFDGDGDPTNDASRALPPSGTLAPLGGHKGYALAIAVELLCGALAGAYPPATSSLFVAAIDPAALTDGDAYAAAVAGMGTAMRSSPPRPGFDRVRLPGEGSAERRAAAERDGIVVPAEVWDAVRRTAARVGVTVADRP